MMGCTVTNSGTIAATDTLFGRKSYLRCLFQSLRIVTPKTSEGASLQKNVSADAVTVMYGKPLNIENCSADHISIPFYL